MHDSKPEAKRNKIDAPIYEQFTISPRKTTIQNVKHIDKSDKNETHDKDSKDRNEY